MEILSVILAGNPISYTRHRSLKVSHVIEASFVSFYVGSHLNFASKSQPSGDTDVLCFFMSFLLVYHFNFGCKARPAGDTDVLWILLSLHVVSYQLFGYKVDLANLSYMLFWFFVRPDVVGQFVFDCKCQMAFSTFVRFCCRRTWFDHGQGPLETSPFVWI